MITAGPADAGRLLLPAVLTLRQGPDQDDLDGVLLLDGNRRAGAPPSNSKVTRS
ncbi:hypothetical protein [Streptomyces sp. CNQ085]|uniref:hypothetical protein n=1 Tax=Streptomyces sp. CNQ085 TaxID=2886944 RepID=UPI001F5140BF|nr:hypothetical protein [Streptomyces sp. CNQ085]MCI0383657.1 hypothetical protein [Streptomyces sp. CNQ085]